MNVCLCVYERGRGVYVFLCELLCMYGCVYLVHGCVGVCMSVSVCVCVGVTVREAFYIAQQNKNT